MMWIRHFYKQAFWNQFYPYLLSKKNRTFPRNISLHFSSWIWRDTNKNWNIIASSKFDLKKRCGIILIFNNFCVGNILSFTNFFIPIRNVTEDNYLDHDHKPANIFGCEWTSIVKTVYVKLKIEISFQRRYHTGNTYMKISRKHRPRLKRRT
jgi:hypothetical protein